MDITTFRQQNPQYDNRTDAELADALYNKYYAGKLDRADFDQRFLGTEPSMLSRAGSAIADAGRGLIGAIQGDAQYPDLPAMTSTMDVQRNWRTGLAAGFGNDEDLMRETLKLNPNLSEGVDANGNPLLVDKQGNPVAYANKPGLDIDDIGRGIAKVTAFAPAAGGAALAASKGFLARVGAGTAGAAATDSTMQKLAGREDIDLAQTALTGAMGGAAEAMAPAIGRAVHFVKSKYKAHQWSRMSEGQRLRAINAQFKKDGIDPSLTEGMSVDDIMTIGAARIQSDDLVSPGATIANQEFKYRTTKGQAMPGDTAAQRAAKFKQLSAEEKLRSTPQGQRYRDVDYGNSVQTDDNIDMIARRFGADDIGDKEAAASSVVEGLRSAEEQTKAAVNAAYATAREQRMAINGLAVQSMPKQLDKALHENNIIRGELTPAASRAYKVFKKFAQRYTNKTDEAVTVSDVPLGDWDDMRKIISKHYDAASTNYDRSAVTVIKRQFDDMLDNVIEQKLFDGDEAAIESLKEARGLYRDYARRFRADTRAGKTIQRLLDEELEDEAVAAFIMSNQGIAKNNASLIARQYGDAVGRDSQSWAAMREMALRSLFKNPAGDTKGHQAIVTTLKRFTKSSLAKELYSEPGELALLRRFTHALDALVPKGDFARSSGTAERLMRWASPGVVANTPIVGDVIAEVVNNWRISGSLALPSAARPISVLPAAGAANNN